MKDLLHPLNKIPGVIGSMVITRDGIMVADATGPELREDAVAALSSALTMTVKRSLEALGIAGDSDEMVLNAEKGKLIFLDLGQAFLDDGDTKSAERTFGMARNLADPRRGGRASQFQDRILIFLKRG